MIAAASIPSRSRPGWNAMRGFYDRIVALVFAIGLLFVAAPRRPCADLTKTRSPASRPIRSATPPTPSTARRRERRSAGRPVARGAARISGCCSSPKTRKSSSRTKADKLTRRRDRRSRWRRRRPISTTCGSTTALRGMIDAALGALTLDGDGAKPTLRRRASRVQVARRQRACQRSTRRSPRKPIRA